MSTDAPHTNKNRHMMKIAVVIICAVAVFLIATLIYSFSLMKTLDNGTTAPRAVTSQDETAPLENPPLLTKDTADQLLSSSSRNMTGEPSYKNSRTIGYRLAEVPTSPKDGSIGGATSFFYQTPDGTWHFFASPQTPMACATFSTAELRKAYLGERCVNDAGGEASVAY